MRWTRRALRRLDDIGTYVGEQSPEAAERLVRRIAEQTETLRAHSRRGRPGRVAGTIEMIVVGTPYIVAYRVDGGEVQVVTVLHAAQAWPKTL